VRRPESTCELTTPGSGLTFRRPGVYVIEALADGVAFARRELRVIAKGPAAVSLAALARVRPGRSPQEKDEPARLPALLVSRGRSPSAEYVLQKGRNVLEREGADVDLEEQEHPERCFISREHCAVTLAKGGLSVEDLGSANGTYVNRQRLEPGEQRPLKAGDVIQ
jgi:pSer/pThr/pTyr-binding forkhead associated (FHA) protein